MNSIQNNIHYLWHIIFHLSTDFRDFLVQDNGCRVGCKRVPIQTIVLGPLLFRSAGYPVNIVRKQVAFPVVLCRRFGRTEKTTPFVRYALSCCCFFLVRLSSYLVCYCTRIWKFRESSVVEFSYIIVINMRNC